MKTFEINYRIKGVFTTIPLSGFIQADNIEQAKALWNAYKDKSYVFCAIREIEIPTTKEEN